MRGRSSGKTAPPATRASPGKAGGLKLHGNTVPWEKKALALAPALTLTHVAV